MQTSALALGLSWVFASLDRANGANPKSGDIHCGLEGGRLRPRAGRRCAAATRIGFGGRAEARRLVCGVFLLALAVLAPRSAPAQLAAKRLDGAAIRAALAGHTIDFPFPSWSAERATAYLAAGGVWRGRYEGKPVTGHWSVKNGRLCLSFPTNPNSECWTVIRNRDGTLRLFTVEGVPAGYLGVVRDNPNKF
jgi:hypothetical protein